MCENSLVDFKINTVFEEEIPLLIGLGNIWISTS